MGLTQDDVVKILNYLEESKFDELHLETGDLKLIVRRKGGSNYAPATQLVESTPAPGRPGEASKEPARQALAGGNESPAAAPSRTEAARPPAQAAPLEGEGLVPIRSTMLGVFYRSPKPGAPPFVEVGSHVKKGETICLIEVMKLFNAVAADVEGRIAQICAEDGQLVEYNQTLFIVEPSELKKVRE